MNPKRALIYPQKQEAGRAQSRPPDATTLGPVPNGPRSQVRTYSGPCPAFSTTLPLEEDPRPSRGGRRKVTKTSQISGLTQDQYLGTYPKIFHFSRIELRWDFIHGRDQISVRLTLGLRNLPKASQSLQSARIREDACLPWLCQAPLGDPIGYSSPHAHPEGPCRVWLSGSQGTRPRGVSHATTLGGCYVLVLGPSLDNAGVGVAPDTGFPPQWRGP